MPNEDKDIIAEQPSLKSILAEYKGSAYIEGDRRTPKEELDKKAQRIIDETTGSDEPMEDDLEWQSAIILDISNEEDKNEENFIPSHMFSNAKKAQENAESEAPDEENSGEDNDEENEPEKKAKKPGFFKRHLRKKSKHEELFEDEDVEDEDIEDEEPILGETFDNSIKISDYTEYADSNYEEYDADAEETEKKGEKKLIQSKIHLFYAIVALFSQRIQSRREKNRLLREAEDDELLNIEEPENLEAEADKYAKTAKSITVRSRIALALCVVMAWLAISFEASGSMFFGLGTSGVLVKSLLMGLLIAVAALCYEIPVAAVTNISKWKLCRETLITLSCFLSLVDGAILLITNSQNGGLSFSAVSAASLVFGMYGLRAYNIGMRNSLRVATSLKTHWGIVTDNESVEDRTILKKQPDSTKGFYRNLMQRDICQTAYSYAVPILLITAAVFAILPTIVLGKGSEFIHILAAMAAMTASFSCMSAYAMPFEQVSSVTRRSGSAVAGWAGAAVMFKADGVLITDSDLFPKGSQSVSGLRLTNIASQYKAIEYAGSLVLASGSELVNPFSDLMRDQGVTPTYVEDFACYDGGGIGGVIRNDNVLIGTGAFMNLMGIRLPPDSGFSNCMFLAINKKLAAAFTLNYVPANSVQSAMVAIRGSKITMLFALKDFIISPKMLQQKFKVSMDGIEYIPTSECYKMTGTEEEPSDSDAEGIISHGSLNAFSETIAKGAQLRQLSLLSTAVSILSSIVGLLLLLFMVWRGPTGSITTIGIGGYMLVMHLVTLILAGLARLRK